MMASTDFIRLTDAAQEFVVSRNKLWSMVKDGTLNTYDDPGDKRVTLLSRWELKELFQVRPFQRGRDESGDDD